jgi:hypothetical protein
MPEPVRNSFAPPQSLTALDNGSIVPANPRDVLETLPGLTQSVRPRRALPWPSWV